MYRFINLLKTKHKSVKNTEVFLKTETVTLLE